MRAKMMVAAFCLTAGFGFVGCSDDSGNNNGKDLSGTVGDMTGGKGDGGGGDGGDGNDFEDFVLGLINTQTSDSTFPTTTEDKTFTDSMDPSKFAGLF